MKALLNFLADAADLVVKFVKSFFAMVMALFGAVADVLEFFTSGKFRLYFPSFVIPLILFVLCVALIRLVLSHGKGE